MFRLLLATAVATLAFTAPASADAVCSLQFDVRFDESGRFTQDGAGQGVCTGNVAGVSLDPGAANPSIAGAAGPGCGLEKGRLELLPRRAFEIWAPEHLELAGEWTAAASALSGTLITGDTAVAISGSIALAGDCSDTGRLHVQLLTGDERPAPRQQAATAAEEPAPAARKPKAARKPRGCRRAKSSRAAKRCRRAARRR